MSEPAEPNAPKSLDGRSGLGLPSNEEFVRWLEADPANEGKFQAIMEEAGLRKFGELTPELRASAQGTIAKRDEQEALGSVHVKMRALLDVMNCPPGTMFGEERLDECNALADEVTDALLETPEPHRTMFLTILLPIREKLRAVRVGD